MKREAAADGDGLQPGASEALWLLLMAMAGMDDEAERLRFAATGVSSLMACRVSGLGTRASPEAP